MIAKELNWSSWHTMMTLPVLSPQTPRIGGDVGYTQGCGAGGQMALRKWLPNVNDEDKNTTSLQKTPLSGPRYPFAWYITI
jgi:hypothetical protein